MYYVDNDYLVKLIDGIYLNSPNIIKWGVRFCLFENNKTKDIALLFDSNRNWREIGEFAKNYRDDVKIFSKGFDKKAIGGGTASIPDFDPRKKSQPYNLVFRPKCWGVPNYDSIVLRKTLEEGLDKDLFSYEIK